MFLHVLTVRDTSKRTPSSFIESATPTSSTFLPRIRKVSLASILVIYVGLQGLHLEYDYAPSLPTVVSMVL